MKGKVLIVEDDQDTRRALQLRVQAEGYEVQTAADGATGIQVAQHNHPDMILLDLGLPAGGDGFQLLDRMANYPAISGVPVIVLSARFSDENKERAKAAGVKTFLAKPPDNQELLKAIRQALGES